MQWCQAQAKDPAIHQIIDSIQNKTIKHLKMQGDMPSELKALIRLKKQLLLKQGVLYRRVTPTDAKPRLQLIPPSHQNKARDVHRCSILSQQLSQVLEKKITSRSSSSTEHRGQSTIGLVHLDYLKIEPSKGNVENVLIITDHFTRYDQAFPSKSQTALVTAKLLWNNSYYIIAFQKKFITDRGRILKVS